MHPPRHTHLANTILHENSSHACISRELFLPEMYSEIFRLLVVVCFFKKKTFVYLSRDILEIQDTEQEEDVETIKFTHLTLEGKHII